MTFLEKDIVFVKIVPSCFGFLNQLSSLNAITAALQRECPLGKMTLVRFKTACQVVPIKVKNFNGLSFFDESMMSLITLYGRVEPYLSYLHKCFDS